LLFRVKVFGQKSDKIDMSLSKTHPEIAAQWHPTKNGDLKPADVTYGSAKKVWWKCYDGKWPDGSFADDHEWEATVDKRSSGRGCPCCAGRKIATSNCLETTHPEVAKLWHLTKNGTLLPKDVVKGSQKKVWWRCPVADDHEWETTVNKRAIGGRGCPFCSSNSVTLSNCFATTHPHLKKYWHTTRNVNLTPFDVAYASNKKVWWKCPAADDHEWLAPVSRISKSDKLPCSCCAGKTVVLSNCLATVRPDLLQYWNYDKNNYLSPFDVTAKSNKKVWWKCPVAKDHEWVGSILNRANGEGCPCCAGYKVVSSNCLSTTNPYLISEWDLTRNKLTPADVTRGSERKVWWICHNNKSHKWYAQINSRTKKNGTGCPFCQASKGEKVVKEILDKHNIKYVTQYRIKECRHKKPLPFDFAILDEVGQLLALIEYQGEQHYRPMRHRAKCKLNFDLIQKRDSIKEQFCRQRGISLLKIPYTEPHIERTTKEFINQL
jgi:hypothetical protein